MLCKVYGFDDVSFALLKIYMKNPVAIGLLLASVGGDISKIFLGIGTAVGIAVDCACNALLICVGGVCATVALHHTRKVADGNIDPVVPLFVDELLMIVPGCGGVS